jgi:hypothetical protein
LPSPAYETGNVHVDRLLANDNKNTAPMATQNQRMHWRLPVNLFANPE